MRKNYFVVCLCIYINFSLGKHMHMIACISASMCNIPVWMRANKMQGIFFMFTSFRICEGDAVSILFCGISPHFVKLYKRYTIGVQAEWLCWFRWYTSTIYAYRRVCSTVICARCTHACACYLSAGMYWIKVLRLCGFSWISIFSAFAIYLYIIEMGK